jgi:cytochrome P450
VPISSLAPGSVHWADWSADPYPLYWQPRDECPVYHDEPNHMHVLTRYEHIDAVLRHHHRYSNIPEWVASGEAAGSAPCERRILLGTPSCAGW